MASHGAEHCFLFLYLLLDSLQKEYDMGYHESHTYNMLNTWKGKVDRTITKSWRNSECGQVVVTHL